MIGGERELVSAATLDGLCCELLIDRARVEACVRSHGALHVEPVMAGAEHSPVICELWQVSDGRSLLGGFDPHRAVERYAEAAAGWLGLGAAAGRALNRLFSLGPYRECLIAVPNVRLAHRSQSHALVLGMITDNPLAHSIDRGFGYGYQKRLGRFQFEDTRRFAVGSDGAIAVSGEIIDDGATDLAHGDPGWLDDYWAQPLLGRLGPRDLRRSWLERRLESPDARVLRVDAHVALSAAFGLGPSSVRGRAVSFERVSARISLPRRLAGG